jgi:hypothetical protein
MLYERIVSAVEFLIDPVSTATVGHLNSLLLGISMVRQESAIRKYSLIVERFKHVFLQIGPDILLQI